jgi:hypothetical protein
MARRGAAGGGCMSYSDETLTLALNLTRNTGYPVFPLAEDKMPAIGKHKGGNGFHDATTDPAQIRRLFAHPRAALIGIPTGEASGFDVLDVDVKHDAARAWLIAAQDRIPATRTYQTRSGGFHLLFRHAEGVHNTESHIAKGIDTRGSGGYAVFCSAPAIPAQIIHQSPNGRIGCWRPCSTSQPRNLCRHGRGLSGAMGAASRTLSLPP